VNVVVLLVGHYWVGALGNPDCISSWLYHQPEIVAAAEVAAYLRANAPAAVPVYVAFSQPAISYLADRPSPYRYLYPQELGALANAPDDLITMVEAASRLHSIVDTCRGAPFRDGGRGLWTAVAQRYHLEATVGELRIYRANE